MCNNCCLKSCPFFLDNVEKYGTAGRRVRIACWITDSYRHTLRMCNNRNANASQNYVLRTLACLVMLSQRCICGLLSSGLWHHVAGWSYGLELGDSFSLDDRPLKMKALYWLETLVTSRMLMQLNMPENVELKCYDRVVDIPWYIHSCTA